MKPGYSILLFVLIGTMACNNTPVEEKPAVEETAPMNSEAFMNAYVDSINVLADSLQRVYNKVLDVAPRSIDSAKMMMAVASPNIEQIKAELDRLTVEAGNLLAKKWISEEDYQHMFLDIRLTETQNSEKTIEALGLRARTEFDTTGQVN